MSRARRQHEIELLRKRYGDLEHGQELDWVMFKQFLLPPGWNFQKIELLVIVPQGYPTTPPDNFYVRDGLRLVDGSIANNYSEGQSVLGGRWAQFSFHAQSWSPGSSLDEGDSLLTFLLAVEQRLKEGK